MLWSYFLDFFHMGGMWSVDAECSCKLYDQTDLDCSSDLTKSSCFKLHFVNAWKAIKGFRALHKWSDFIIVLRTHFITILFILVFWSNSLVTAHLKIPYVSDTLFGTCCYAIFILPRWGVHTGGWHIYLTFLLWSNYRFTEDCKGNTERPHVPFTQFLPIVTRT